MITNTMPDSPQDSKPKINSLIDLLLTEHPLFEPAFLSWLGNILSGEHIPSFIHLADNHQYFLRLSQATNIQTAIPLSPYISEATLTNYVVHLLEIWKDLKGFPIYTISRRSFMLDSTLILCSRTTSRI